jgi:hypothetical protein
VLLLFDPTILTHCWATGLSIEPAPVEEMKELWIIASLFHFFVSKSSDLPTTLGVMQNKTNIRIRKFPIGGRRGTLHIEIGRVLRPHEQDTVDALLAFGFDIVCKNESNVPYQHTADIVWRNENWEIKAPTGNTRHTVRNNLRRGKRQSANIIIDISWSQVKMSSAINSMKKHVRESRETKKAMIVCHGEYCVIERGAI